MSLEFIKPTYSAVKSVNGKIGNVEITAENIGAVRTQDLEGLATKKYVDEKILQVQTGGGVDLSDYALKTDIPDLEPYALKTDIPETPDLTPYALKTDIPTVPNAVSGLQNDVGYQTAAQVEAAITTALGNIGVAEEGAY